MNMKLNTIAMAILSAGLIGMVTGKATQFLYDGGPEHPGGHHEEKRGYSIEVVEDAGAGGAVAPSGPTDISALYASADIAAGGDYFNKKCSTCHTIEKGEAAKVGPNLYGIVGGPRAHMAGFSYSDAVKNAGGKWGWDELNAWFWNPKKAIPGTIMAYAGDKKDQERANLIAFLNSKGSNLPYPPVTKPAENAAGEAAKVEGDNPAAEKTEKKTDTK